MALTRTRARSATATQAAVSLSCSTTAAHRWAFTLAVSMAAIIVGTAPHRWIFRLANYPRCHWSNGGLSGSCSPVRVTSLQVAAVLCCKWCQSAMMPRSLPPAGTSKCSFGLVLWSVRALIQPLFCKKRSNGVSRATPKRKHRLKWPTWCSDGSGTSKPPGILTMRSGAQTGRLKPLVTGSGN